MKHESSATYVPISCEHYDYLELACIKRLTLRVELLDGAQHQGEAVNVEARKNKGEWLSLSQEGGLFDIRLDQIKAISAVRTKAESHLPFERLDF